MGVDIHAWRGPRLARMGTEGIQHLGCVQLESIRDDLDSSFGAIDRREDDVAGRMGERNETGKREESSAEAAL